MWQENFCSGDDTEGSILPSDYKRLLDGSGFECLDFQYQPQCFRVPPNTIDIYLTKKVLRAYADDFSTHNCFEQFSFEFKSRIQEYFMTYGKLEMEYDGLKILAQPC